MKDVRDEEQIMPEEKSQYDRDLQTGYAMDAFDPLAGGAFQPSAVAAGISIVIILAAVVASFY